MALCINCIDCHLSVCLCELLLQPGLSCLGSLPVQAFPFGNDRPLLSQPPVLTTLLLSAGSFHVSFVPRHGGAVFSRSPHPLNLAGGIRGGNLTWAPPPRSPCASPTTSWKRKGPLEGVSLTSLLSFTHFWNSLRGRGWGSGPPTTTGPALRADDTWALPINKNLVTMVLCIALALCSPLPLGCFGCSPPDPPSG